MPSAAHVKLKTIKQLNKPQREDTSQSQEILKSSKTSATKPRDSHKKPQEEKARKYPHPKPSTEVDKAVAHKNATKYASPQLPDQVSDNKAVIQLVLLANEVGLKCIKTCRI